MGNHSQQLLSGKLFVKCLKESQELPDITKVQDLLEELEKQDVPQVETMTNLLTTLNAPKESIHNVEAGTKPKLDEEKIKAAYSKTKMTAALAAEPFTTDCLLKMAAIIGDCIGIVLAAMGICPTVARRVGICIANYAELERVSTSVMRTLIEEFNNARGLARAKIVLKIAQQGINSLGTGLLLRAIAHEMKWYDWVATAVWFIGELAAFLATDGFALAGQVLIILGTATFIGIDIDQYVENCCL